MDSMREHAISSLPPEHIGPEEPKAFPVERQERRERADGLAQYIHTWWRGDAHVHSSKSTEHKYGHFEALYNPDEIAGYEKNLGLEFTVITDHASNPGSPRVLAVDDPICESLLHTSAVAMDRNKKHTDEFAVLSGVEANILFDADDVARIDVPDEIASKLDLVIASRHKIDRSKEPAAIRASLEAAIANQNVDVIGHPDRSSRKNKETDHDYWREYWAVWPPILEKMRDTHKAFDINLNAPPSEKLLKMAIQIGVTFFINFDAHDFNQYQKELNKREDVQSAKQHWGEGELSSDDKRILQDYKLEMLGKGPGVVAILHLVRMLKRLENFGVTPDRIVNSSLDNLLHFLTETRGKKTENLDLLIGKRNNKDRDSAT